MDVWILEYIIIIIIIYLLSSGLHIGMGLMLQSYIVTMLYSTMCRPARKRREVIFKGRKLRIRASCITVRSI